MFPFRQTPISGGSSAWAKSLKTYSTISKHLLSLNRTLHFSTHVPAGTSEEIGHCTPLPSLRVVFGVLHCYNALKNVSFHHCRGMQKITLCDLYNCACGFSHEKHPLFFLNEYLFVKYIPGMLLRKISALCVTLSERIP